MLSVALCQACYSHDFIHKLSPINSKVHCWRIVEKKDVSKTNCNQNSASEVVSEMTMFVLF